MKPAFIRSLSGGSQLNGCRPVSRTRLGWRGTHSSGVLRAEGGRRVSAAAGKVRSGWRCAARAPPACARARSRDCASLKFVGNLRTLGRVRRSQRCHTSANRTASRLWSAGTLGRTRRARVWPWRPPSARSSKKKPGRKSEPADPLLRSQRARASGGLGFGSRKIRRAGRNPRLLDRREPRARPEERRCLAWCWEA